MKGLVLFWFQTLSENRKTIKSSKRSINPKGVSYETPFLLAGELLFLLFEKFKHFLICKHVFYI